MRRKGRRVALWTGVVVTLLLVTLLLVTLLLGTYTLVFHTTPLEYWYIAGLYSKRDIRRVQCADKLATMKSLGAVPYLVDRIREDEREMPITVRTMPKTLYLKPLIHALHQLGPTAHPAVEHLLAGEDQERLRRIPEFLKEARVAIVIKGEYSYCPGVKFLPVESDPE